MSKLILIGFFKHLVILIISAGSVILFHILPDRFSAHGLSWYMVEKTVGAVLVSILFFLTTHGPLYIVSLITLHVLNLGIIFYILAGVISVCFWTALFGGAEFFQSSFAWKLALSGAVSGAIYYYLDKKIIITKSEPC